MQKKLGGSETARELLAEEASVSRTTCQQLRGALTSCHDTVAKEQKRAAAAARAHGEVKARLQKDIMDLTKVSFQWKNPDFLFKNPDLLSVILISD